MWFTLKPEVHVPCAKDGPVVGVAVGGHQPPDPEALSLCSTASSSCVPDTLPLPPWILLEQRKTQRERRAWLLKEIEISALYFDPTVKCKVRVD